MSSLSHSCTPTISFLSIPIQPLLFAAVKQVPFFPPPLPFLGSTLFVSHTLEKKNGGTPSFSSPLCPILTSMSSDLTRTSPCDSFSLPFFEGRLAPSYLPPALVCFPPPTNNQFCNPPPPRNRPSTIALSYPPPPPARGGVFQPGTRHSPTLSFATISSPHWNQVSFLSHNCALFASPHEPPFPSPFFFF